MVPKKEFIPEGSHVNMLKFIAERNMFTSLNWASHVCAIAAFWSVFNATVWQKTRFLVKLIPAEVSLAL